MYELNERFDFLHSTFHLLLLLVVISLSAPVLGDAWTSSTLDLSIILTILINIPTTSSELSKLAANAFLAQRISSINSMSASQSSSTWS